MNFKAKTLHGPSRGAIASLAACLASILLATGAPAPLLATPEAAYVKTHNHYVTVEGARLAYRAIGIDRHAPPLVLLQHFTGTMDDWDSSLIDALSQRRRVIILGNPGVGASVGAAPDSVDAMAHLTEGFIDALHLGKVDLLGFSIGGSVAQKLVAERPEVVRKLILVGAGPQGGEGIKDLQVVIAEGFRRGGELKIDPKVPLFFTSTQNGMSEGAAFLKRIHDHTVDIEPVASQAAVGAQAKALITWGLSQANYAELEAIKQPVLIVNGSHDLIIPTINSYVLYQHIPNARLILYPDSGHGSLFQYHDLFVSEVNGFLDD
ncbi:alpha/beta fold hydrolase [Bradyrhizobium genosp. A]|uniref:alpha/beta fold hydrolase n=1 Tax=Bradyrhizobium genosp. A TaxID=83626 RepID=UPI003CF6F2CF